MKKQVLFVHSAGAQGPNEGSNALVAWLRKQLSTDYEVLYPLMPHPESPAYEPWKAQFEKEMASAVDGVILAGHSLGGSVLLKYLSESSIDKHIAGLFLVATPYWGEKGWEVAEFMLQDDFHTKLPHIPAIFLYHGKYDPVVSSDHLTRYAEKLPAATVRHLNNGEHQFASGLPELAEDIKNL